MHVATRITVDSEKLNDALARFSRDRAKGEAIELLAEAGLAAGVCNIVTGYGPEVGAPMTTDPDVDMISFIGSTAVGPLGVGGPFHGTDDC
jgi:Aldehyde dehydrogenase family